MSNASLLKGLQHATLVAVQGAFVRLEGSHAVQYDAVKHPTEIDAAKNM